MLVEKRMTKWASSRCYNKRPEKQSDNPSEKLPEELVYYLAEDTNLNTYHCELFNIKRDPNHFGAARTRDMKLNFEDPISENP